MPAEPVEFDCLDCGVHVYSFGIEKPPAHGLCEACRVIRTVPTADQDALREALLDSDARDYWRDVGSKREAVT